MSAEEKYKLFYHLDNEIFIFFTFEGQFLMKNIEKNCFRKNHVEPVKLKSLLISLLSYKLLC